MNDLGYQLALYKKIKGVKRQLAVPLNNRANWF
jgi:hypothetical protein